MKFNFYTKLTRHKILKFRLDETYGAKLDFNCIQIWNLIGFSLFFTYYIYIYIYRLAYSPCICTVQLKKITIAHIYGFKLYSLSLSLIFYFNLFWIYTWVYSFFFLFFFLSFWWFIYIRLFVFYTTLTHPEQIFLKLK